ncbi:MAG: FAD-dependent oxidoreductase [Candidatus Binatia bacterium]|nr:FAD-dependent oxidoreductase [Candidatus Binatia bacterium]
MKIAIIGTGISGLTVARGLAEHHDLHVFEADDRIGGHTHTTQVRTAEGTLPVDTGFIVFNERTYPNFCKLLDELDVPSRETNMSFSLSCRQSGLEWSGDTINSLFAQRRNLLRPSFLAMLRDVLRFNREGRRFLEDHRDLTLGEYLLSSGYSESFVHQFLLPLGAAIWSTPAEEMKRFPAHSFIRFFENHGFLDLVGRPKWRTIRGGSQEYVRPLTRSFADRIRTRCPVLRVVRLPGHVRLEFDGTPAEIFDEVVFAIHSDQALTLLADPSRSERQILGALPYQRNLAVLHTDERALPRNQRAWASWNYLVPPDRSRPVALTYWMNRLQGLQSNEQICVTLNPTFKIRPERIQREIHYQHPLFTRAGIAAQKQKAEISGVNRTHYCGAYWRHGFHEDGVVSAIAVLDDIEHASQISRFAS